jgi:hypothetical protein
MTTLKTTQDKLIKYYNQTQNDLRLLYDKTILLHFTIDDTMFQSTKWKVEFEETFWSQVYWNALKDMYDEYKYQTNENSFFRSKQVIASLSKTLNDISNDNATFQTSFDENEFFSYQRQDMLYLTYHLFRTYLYINSYSNLT